MSKINKENILNVSILIFAIFPIIPNTIKGLPVILFFIASVFLYEKSEVKWKGLLINSSLFIAYAISLLYSDDDSVSLQKLETGLSILVIPITFFVLLPHFNILTKFKRVFIKTFISSTTLFSIYSIICIALSKPSLDYLWRTDKYRSLIMDMPIIGQHPIYASIFLALATLFFVYLLKHRMFKSSKEKLYFSTLTLINCISLIFLSSKGPILALLIIVLFFFIIETTNMFYKHLTIVVFAISLVTLFIYNRRMNELIKPKTYEVFNPHLSTSIRLGIFDCSLAIIKNKFLIGYGVGDAQRQLNICYASKSDLLLMHRYNSHNQYLDVTIKTGLIGLFIFLGFLLVNFRDAIKNKNQLLVMILTLYCILFLVENILSRQSGVILFFFLICFLNHPERTSA